MSCHYGNHGWSQELGEEKQGPNVLKFFYSTHPGPNPAKKNFCFFTLGPQGIFSNFAL